MATVLLLLDLQNGITDRFPKEYMEPYLARVALVVQKAREAGIQVVHVVSSFRPGYPELCARNTSTARVLALGNNAFVQGDSSTGIHTAVAPVQSEVVVAKHRVSAFASTDLDMVLRCAGVENVVIAGLITSGAVLSTVRQAADLDYGITVLKDLCMDRDPEVHQVLTEKVFARHTVVSGEEWVAGLKSD
ncbi:hypothetical protein ASPZODRAFT_218328 [Penicilliopsis zonata CBS 506.65]|uniref:Isochorismatase-like domain-containing protein n=1 Tax=Penicilliopsis zonata CBS 506.65 TaxID=1073090 RepID=A0A1L9SU03_9EURO|nr:hypothetical protein ASPZODRAFT_218328 [Penicilliopsis zonata CBS 506.65]OJJ50601.1 hypothetical protein ASPZODRAFT_218328 [Penicilliopsis zonata CBS 506.65]